MPKIDLGPVVPVLDELAFVEDVGNAVVDLAVAPVVRSELADVVV